MAVTSAVLVNDGGAPARIMNFLAAEAITAGLCLEIITSAVGPKVQMHDSPDSAVAGFALADAAAGDMCSVITGKGIQLNVHVDGGTTNIAIGDDLEVITGGALAVAGAAVNTDDLRIVCAVALEATTETAANHLLSSSGGGVQLFKVLVL